MTQTVCLRIVYAEQIDRLLGPMAKDYNSHVRHLRDRPIRQFDLSAQAPNHNGHPNGKSVSVRKDYRQSA